MLIMMLLINFLILVGEHQVTYIRRCEMVSYEKDVGTCYDPVARGISLDFCEYCDYDGCNSATSLKLNVILASLVLTTRPSVPQICGRP